MAEPYEPVSCGFHDILEDASVRKRECRIVFRADARTIRDIRTTIADIFVRDGAEYALLGPGLKVRLDRLVQVELLDPGASNRCGPDVAGS